MQIWAFAADGSVSDGADRQKDKDLTVSGKSVDGVVGRCTLNSY
jgi:hypothetical protein